MSNAEYESLRDFARGSTLSGLRSIRENLELLIDELLPPYLVSRADRIWLTVLNAEIARRIAA